MRRVHEIVEAVKAYDPQCDEDLIARAYVFAMKAHSDQRRANGDPYFSHPVEVAGILAEMRLDATCVAAGLLHDTLEDTSATPDELRGLFGPDVLRLVEGVTKLAKVPTGKARPDQSANLRKLLLAMADDLRVLLVKLADRLHNMRTLRFIAKPEKRARIARETLEIHAPLADRLGLGEWRTELEDRAFAELYPDMRRTMIERLQRRGGDEIDTVREAIRVELAKAGLAAEVTGRTKSPYSIWRKMEVRGVGLDDMADLIAVRAIVADENACYTALGIIHRAWSALPGRFKDYISMPKANGYMSLHTAVIGPHRKAVEIQIRTAEMHQLAEHGIAAHWSYKDGAPAGGARFDRGSDLAPGEDDAAGANDGRSHSWIRRIVEDISEHEGAADVLRDVHLELYRDKVFCFTPQGAVVELPRGATILDFAYAIHSELGRRAAGAKRNGENVPLGTVLDTGDRIEIATEEGREPDAGSESLVTTGRAKAAIKRHARAMRRAALRDLGTRLLDRALSGRTPSPSEFARAAIDLGCADLDELFERIGEGALDPSDAAEAAAPKGTARRLADALMVWKRRQASPLRLPERLDGIAFRPAACCAPIYGDPIAGIHTPGLGGVQVHAASCPELSGRRARPEDWVDLTWTRKGVVVQSAHLLARINNRPGALGALCDAIGAHDCNITDLFFSGRTADCVEAVAAITPEGNAPLAELIPRLLALPSVVSAAYIDDHKARALLEARRRAAPATATTWRGDALDTGSGRREGGRWEDPDTPRGPAV